AAGAVDGGARRLHPGNRKVEVIERRGAFGRVLDRQPGHAGRDAARDAVGDAARIVGKAVLEVGVYRNVRRLDQFAQMRKHVVTVLRAVGAALRVGVAATRQSQGLEAEAFEIARAADIPRIRDDEAAGLMELAKGLAL